MTLRARTSERKPLRLGVLIGGGGRTLLNIADHIERGELAAVIRTVIAPREGAAGVQRARDRGLPVTIIPPKDSPDEAGFHDAVSRHLRESDVDLVCLAGYMRWFQVEPGFVGRVMNIHPALLPRFGGKGMFGERVQEAVLERGEAITGCTVHFVDDTYDHGPIILQKTCPVYPDDSVASLAARVFELECAAYPEAIRLFAEGRLHVDGDRVAIHPHPATGEIE